MLNAIENSTGVHETPNVSAADLVNAENSAKR